MRMILTAAILAGCGDSGDELVPCAQSWYDRESMMPGFTGMCAPQCAGDLVSVPFGVCAISPVAHCEDLPGTVTLANTKGMGACCLPQPIADGATEFDIVKRDCQP